MGTEHAVFMYLVAVIVGILFLLGIWIGHRDCERDHPVHCRCKHGLDAHAETMPCSLCDCKDFAGVEDGN